MSKQTSIVKFKGKMDGISFYEQGGVAMARKAKGPSKERIMTDPNYERTRQNMSEFSGLALGISTMLRSVTRIKTMRDKTLRGRVSRRLRQILKSDQAVRGQRSLVISQHKNLLQGLEFNTGQLLDNVFGGIPEYSHNANRSSATITLTNLSENDLPAIPHLATHFRLVQFLGVVSDVVFNADLKSYQVVNAGIEKASNVTFSDYLPVRGGGDINVTLETALALRGQPLANTTSVMQCLGIIFFEKEGPLYYPIKDKAAMQVLEVF